MTPLDKITLLADELTEPRINREPYTVWTGSRHRKTQHHVTVQHGLLKQLYLAVVPTWATSDEPGVGVPASRPPLEIEAVSRHEQIDAGAKAWCQVLGVRIRVSPESNIRALVGAASSLDLQGQRDLAADLRRWNTWCKVYLGLEKIETFPKVRCMVADCDVLGALRVNLTTSYGLCTACGATWNEDTIGVLAEHIRRARSSEGQRA